MKKVRPSVLVLLQWHQQVMGEGLLSSGLDAVTLGWQERGRVSSLLALQQRSGKAVREQFCFGPAAALAGWRAALLWHRRRSVYPQTSLTTVAEY